MNVPAERIERDEGAYGPLRLEALAEQQRDELGRALERAEPCYALWMSVVTLALRDLAYLEEKEGKVDLTSHERSKLNRLREHDPAAFLNGPWFDDICGYLGVSADWLRRSTSGPTA